MTSGLNVCALKTAGTTPNCSRKNLNAAKLSGLRSGALRKGPDSSRTDSDDGISIAEKGFVGKSGTAPKPVESVQRKLPTAVVRTASNIAASVRSYADRSRSYWRETEAPATPIFNAAQPAL